MFIIYLTIILVAVLILSVWQGSYNCDPHHWGLMLSNARDFDLGKIPYRDIFIQYGIVTTIIHGFAYKFFGGNLQCLIFITAAFYGFGIILSGVLAREISRSYKVGVFTATTLFLYHPLAIYPWSNYITFNFILIALTIAINTKINKYFFILAGVSFALAILSRESVAVAVIPIIISTTISIALNKTIIARIEKISLLIVSTLFPIFLFIVYLYLNNLINYWIKLSILLPKIYLTTTFKPISFLEGWFNFIFKAIILNDLRVYLVISVILVNTYIFLKYIFLSIKTMKFNIPSSSVQIAFAALILITSSLHLIEHFRIATGVMIGIVNLYYLSNKFNPQISNIVFSASILLFFPTLIYNNSGNYFPPPPEINKYHLINSYIKVFNGQRWSNDLVNYYEKIRNDLELIKIKYPKLKYQHNSTMDAFIQVITPFDQFQIAPFGTLGPIDGLRSDINYQEKITDGKDIILFLTVRKPDFESFENKNEFTKFKIYKKYTQPSQFFIEPNNFLVLLVPKNIE